MEEGHARLHGPRMFRRASATKVDIERPGCSMAPDVKRAYS